MSFSFAKFVDKKVLTSAGGSNAELARMWGVSEMQIGRWRDGQVPLFSTILELLDKLGGDIERAFPDWFPEEQKNIRMGGPVTGGVLSAVSHDEHDVKFSDLWRKSPMWDYAFQESPVKVVPVRGDSMAPTYPDGCIIALGEYNGRALPQGAPCVFRTGSTESDMESTFKLYRVTTDGVVIGWPLNPIHPPVLFRRKPVIQYVVLGICNPNPQPDIQPDLKRRVKL